MTPEQRDAFLRLTCAIADAIRELGEVPSGHLYARVMDKVSFNVYTAVIDVLVHGKLVSKRNHLLTWIGPRIEQTEAKPQTVEQLHPIDPRD